MPSPRLRPYWETSDGETVRLYLGEVRDVLARLSDESVHCCVTSPPYWGLRDYGTASWEGGDDGCDHDHTNKGTVEYLDRNGNAGSNNTTCQGGKRHSTAKLGDVCKKCGATRTDSQIGSEPSPDCGTQGKAQCGACFVCSIVSVFREVYRVLRSDGTCWLNLGDTYSQTHTGVGKGRQSETFNDVGNRYSNGILSKRTERPPLTIPSGNLVGVPWRVALALQADGWILRQDVIWHKPAPMPESVRNRCTKAHEYVFLLVKKGGYYCDMEAVKERLKMSDEDYARMLKSKERQNSSKLGSAMKAGAGRKDDGFNSFISDGKTAAYVPNGSNRRSVWTVPSQGYPGAHFATFPPKLIEPMIRSGTSEKGCCGECGAPWKRVTTETKLTRDRPNDYVKRTGEDGTGNVCSNSVAGVEVRTVGWEPSCDCGTEDNLVPCTVLDPFVGSGTTCEVALVNDRRSIGIDLSEAYLRKNAVPRITSVITTRPWYTHLLPRGQ